MATPRPPHHQPPVPYSQDCACHAPDMTADLVRAIQQMEEGQPPATTGYFSIGSENSDLMLVLDHESRLIELKGDIRAISAYMLNGNKQPVIIELRNGELIFRES